MCKREEEEERERERERARVDFLKKSFSGYVFIYTVRADINLLTLLIVHSLQILTQVKMMLFSIKTLTKMSMNK